MPMRGLLSAFLANTVRSTFFSTATALDSLTAAVHCTYQKLYTGPHSGRSVAGGRSECRASTPVNERTQLRRCRVAAVQLRVASSGSVRAPVKLPFPFARQRRAGQRAEFLDQAFRGIHFTRCSARPDDVRKCGAPRTQSQRIASGVPRLLKAPDRLGS